MPFGRNNNNKNNVENVKGKWEFKTCKTYTSHLYLQLHMRGNNDATNTLGMLLYGSMCVQHMSVRGVQIYFLFGSVKFKLLREFNITVGDKRIFELCIN